MAAEVFIAKEGSVNPSNAIGGNQRVPQELTNVDPNFRSSVQAAYRRVVGLSDEQKAKVTPYGDPSGYTALSRTSPERKELLSLLKEKGTVVEYVPENPTNSGEFGMFKVGNTAVNVHGLTVEVGTLKKVGAKLLQGERNNPVGYRRYSKPRTDFKSKYEFNIYERDKLNELMKKLRAR